jgi:glycosyltransferase involved in cell wall biosynthesis
VTRRALHQFVPVMEPGAVGGHIQQIRRLAHGLGLDAPVWAEVVHPTMRSFTQEYRRYKGGPDDVLMYHVAVGSPVADFVLGRPETLVVDHHNITPVRWFAPWQPGGTFVLSWGRAQLADLAGRATLGVADSRFNESELIQLGYPRTAVAPILLDLDAFGATPVDEGLVASLRGRGAVWLFVSRVAPNKGHHDLIKAFSVYRQVYDPQAVLRIVGFHSLDAYDTALRSFVSALGLEGAVEFTGTVTDEDKVAHYRAADVFVHLSDHEGFAVPVLEAWHHGLPIVAYGSTAIPETLGRAGLCLPHKKPTTVAAAVHRVLTDDGLRAALVGAGHERLQTFSLTKTRARMADALAPVLG